MRPIDGDALVEDLRKVYADNGWSREEIHFSLRDMEMNVQFADEVETIPTIDAVPVVRCKDCRYSDDYYNDGCCYCKYSEHEMRYIGTDWNWYCAGGERRDDQRSENIADNGKN